MTDEIRIGAPSALRFVPEMNILNAPRIAYAPEGAAAADASGTEGGEADAGAADAGKTDAGADAGKTDSNAGAANPGKKDENADAGSLVTGAGKDGEGADRDGGAHDWRAGIEDQSLRDFAGKFTTPADMAKAAMEFRQTLSRSITVPGKDASEKDTAAFRKAIGVPETVEGYEFSMPEGQEASESDKAFQSKMAEVFHKTGVPAASAKALNDAWNEMTAEARDEQDRVASEKRGESEAALKKEWGADYDANAQLAGRVIRSHASPEFVSFLENTEVEGQKLGDHPEMMRLMAKIGRRMDEHGFIGVSGAEEQGTIRDEINQIMRDNPPGTEKYKDPKIQARLRELNEKLHGTGGIVGSAGRAA